MATFELLSCKDNPCQRLMINETILPHGSSRFILDQFSTVTEYCHVYSSRANSLSFASRKYPYSSSDYWRVWNEQRKKNYCGSTDLRYSSFEKHEVPFLRRIALFLALCLTWRDRRNTNTVIASQMLRRPKNTKHEYLLHPPTSARKWNQGGGGAP